jgi:NAD+ diphosphatase
MYNFCPKCGSNKIQNQNPTLSVCTDCNFEIFNNPKPTTTTVIMCNNLVMLGRRNRDPQKDKWGYGGGFLDYGENAYQAGIREIKEEVGMEVEELIYLTSLAHDYEYKGDHKKINSTVFVAFVDEQTKQKATPADDVGEIRWVTLEELNRIELAFEPFATEIKKSLFQYLGYSPNSNLVTLRQAIDDLDSELLRLLAVRMNLVNYVADYKKENQLPILNPIRWQEVINNRLELAKKLNLDSDFVSYIWNRIHQESIQKEQQRIREK